MAHILVVTLLRRPCSERGADDAQPENSRPENDGPGSFWNIGLYDKVFNTVLAQFSVQYTVGVFSVLVSFPDFLYHVLQ